MKKFTRAVGAAMLALSVMVMFSGCEKKHGGSSGDVVGSWRLSSYEGVMIFVFSDDGSMQFQGEDGSVGARGSWSGSSDGITGTWTATSGAKDGSISATISDGVMNLAFIENVPPKTVQYSGSKM